MIRQTPVMFALLVVGPPGSGKTTALDALHDLLTKDDIKHAVVEAEALAWCHPPLLEKDALGHLAAIRAAYEDAGFGLFICSATITSPEHMENVRTAISADEWFVVRLEADPKTLAARVTERESPGWSGLAPLLAASREIAARGANLQGVHLVLSTEEISPAQVAERICAANPVVFNH
jgi:energy-coupling factor transporter ATP-binding protein EcfA2